MSFLTSIKLKNKGRPFRKEAVFDPCPRRASPWKPGAFLFEIIFYQSGRREAHTLAPLVFRNPRFRMPPARGTNRGSPTPSAVRFPSNKQATKRIYPKRVSRRHEGAERKRAVSRPRRVPLGYILFVVVGPPGIEPGLYEPESHVLPVYYGP